ncbi:MAG TPA: hypothetical protein VIJ26_14120 [Thermoanaerobaculia bacterium]
MRKILMLAVVLTLSLASQLPAVVECACTYCQRNPNASCTIHTDFLTGCTAYYQNFCVE